MTRVLLPSLGVCAFSTFLTTFERSAHAQDAGIAVADGGVSDGSVALPPDGGADALPTVATARPAAPVGLPVTAETPLEPGADRETGIRGHIYDRRAKTPLEMAPVVVTGGGKTRSLTTNEQGGYRIFLPPGVYTVRSYYDLYHGARIEGARVTRGKLLELNLQLQPLDENQDISVEEQEIAYRADTSTAAAQDQLRQAQSGIAEGFGAKQMSQVGASDASSAAAKVVGVSIDNDQVVIRGLAGRYSRVLLNGVPVPSLDPDVPGADLDLFPQNMIDRLSVSKTFLPNIPADFAGGVLEIQSVNFPRKATFQVNLSSGFDTMSTGRSKVDYRGGRYDFLGFDDGRRGIPAGALGLPRPMPLTNEQARAFRNVWDYDHRTARPRLGVDLTAGDSVRFGHQNRFGYLLLGGYNYDDVRRVGISRPNNLLDPSGNLIVPGQLQRDYRQEVGSEEVQLSGLATASLDLGPNHSFTLLSLFNRSTTDRTAVRKGVNLEGEVERWQLQYLARQLWFNQVFGDSRNLFGTRMRLRWSAFQSSGERDEPDRRVINYQFMGGAINNGYEWTENGESGTRFYALLKQNDVGGNLSLRFPLWAEAWATLGGYVQSTSRDFDNRRFRMRKDTSGATPGAYFQRPEDMYNAANIGRIVYMEDATRAAQDSYAASQLLYAGYLMVETPLYGALSLAGGVRAEVMRQRVNATSPYPERPALSSADADRTDVDYLPGAALKLELSERMLLRAAYGRTVARPQIRELANFSYYDFYRERSVSGNPELKRTQIQNVDLRWEWFFAEGQILAVSAFYKKFDKPIELVIDDILSLAAKYNNGTNARNLGFEFEARTSLERFLSTLKAFSVDFNLALVQSRIDLPAEARAVRSNRPLIGQSPYVTNLSLRYNNDNAGVTAALVYNVVGPRIVDAVPLQGTGLPPDITEAPFHSLDVVASWEMTKNLKLKARLRNLLMQNRRLFQGSFLVDRVDLGLMGSLGLTYSY